MAAYLIAVPPEAAAATEDIAGLRILKAATDATVALASAKRSLRKTYYQALFDPAKVSVGGAASFEEITVEVEASTVLGSFKPNVVLEPISKIVDGGIEQQTYPCESFADISSAAASMIKIAETWDIVASDGPRKTALLAPFLRNFRILDAAAKRALEAVQDTPSCREAIAARLAVINAGLAEVGAIGWDFFPPVGPRDLSWTHASLLQTWVGGTGSPSAWVEVYRGSRDGFGHDAFIAKCLGKPRLLILVKEKVGGWLFGGFTAAGFMKRDVWQVDGGAFVFTLINSQGLPPAKFASKGHVNGLHTGGGYAFIFGGDNSLRVNSDSNSAASASSNIIGTCYAAPAAGGPGILAGGAAFSVAETVAWIMPQ